MPEVLVIYIAPEGWNKKSPKSLKNLKKRYGLLYKIFHYPVGYVISLTSYPFVPSNIIILIGNRKWDNIIIDVYV